MEFNMNPDREQFIRMMDNFPCMFNVGMIKKPSQNRLELQRKKMEHEVCEDQDEYEDEKPLKLNALCWIYFQLGNTKKAKEKNDESLVISPRNNLLSLGNQAFMEWYTCSDNSNCLQELERLMTEPEFDNDLLNAKAGQAYLLLRLGGKYNLSLGLRLYTEVTRKEPENYQWKYFQGVTCHRLDTMTRDIKARRAEGIFRDIADNTNDSRLKSLALSELATLLSSEESVSITHIEELIEKALYLRRDYATVYKNCGIAMKAKGDPRAIFHFEKAIALKAASVSHHLLAKCYMNFKLTSTLKRHECHQKAIHHFNEAYLLSMGENVQPMIDLAFLLRIRNMTVECLEQCKVLIKNWSLKEILSSPFTIAKIHETFYYALQTSVGHGGKDLNRFLSMAISTSLELFKRSVSQEDKECTFNQIVDYSKNKLLQRTFAKPILGLLKCSVHVRCARQILIRLAREDMLEKEEIKREIQLLLDENRPDEALLLLDILDLRQDNSPVVSKERVHHIVLEEAKWELSEGLVACKLLFHRMFNSCHFGHQMNSPEKEETQGAVDVLFLYDGPHWKPFLQHDTEDQHGNSEIVTQYRVYEEVLYYLFDLEVISNPWLSLSQESNFADELSTLLKSHNVKLVLLLIDDNSSSQFLKFADYILAPIVQGTATPKATADVAIICGDDSDRRDQLPNLRDARYFDARTNGLIRRLDDLPIENMSGTEILDAYFSGSVDNAVNFFNFLAPPRY